MKKSFRITAAVVAAVIAGFVLAACGTGVPTEYKIKFDSGEGGTFAGGMHTVEMTTEGGKIAEPPTLAAKSGYVFVCFNTRADGTGDEITSDTVFAADCTVYAVWDNVGKKKADALEKAVTAMGELARSGFDADGTGEFSSDNIERKDLNFAFTYADGRATVTATGRAFALDTATGELFEDKGNGFEKIRQLYTQEAASAVGRMLSSLGAPDYVRLAEYVTLDEDANTVTFAADIAREVNAELSVLYNAYARNYSVSELIDAYLARGVNAGDEPYTVSSIIDGLIAAAVRYKDDSLDAFIGRIDGLFGGNSEISVEALIKLFIDEEEYDEVKERKVGQIAAGLTLFMKEWTDGTVENNAVAQRLIYDLLYADTQFTAKTEAELTVAGAAAKAALGGSKVKTIVDNLEETDEARVLVKAIVKNGVKLKRANIKVTATLDDRTGAISALHAEFDIEHDFEQESDLPFLSDNNYSVNFDIALGD